MKKYNASEYLPPVDEEQFSANVYNQDGDLVCYDHRNKRWINEMGDMELVSVWSYPEPVKVAPEKTAHQLQEELKQAQFEIEEMKNVITHLNSCRTKRDRMLDQLKETFEKLLTSQFSLCESRDVWRKRAGLVQKCEE